jgi:hypothetical protein
MGGEFAEHSFASGYPESRDLFLERAWKLDEDGGFVAPAEGNAGVLLGGGDVELVEFWEARQEGNRDGEQITE